MATNLEGSILGGLVFEPAQVAFGSRLPVPLTAVAEAAQFSTKWSGLPEPDPPVFLAFKPKDEDAQRFLGEVWLWLRSLAAFHRSPQRRAVLLAALERWGPALEARPPPWRQFGSAGCKELFRAGIEDGHAPNKNLITHTHKRCHVEVEMATGSADQPRVVQVPDSGCLRPGEHGG